MKRHVIRFFASLRMTNGLYVGDENEKHFRILFLVLSPFDHREESFEQKLLKFEVKRGLESQNFSITKE